MKVIIKSIRITDLDGKKSKFVQFKDGTNLLTSKNNSVGKSVIMKAIYHSLGADSFYDEKFKRIKNLLIETSFSFDKNNYTFLRYNDAFCILKNGDYYGHYKKQRAEISKFYENELGMSVYLRSRDGRAELAPPAYLFIPYYLDQDRSWKEEQYPFSKESMQHFYEKATNELFLYHLGVFDKNYGQLKAKIDSIKDRVSKLQGERSNYDNTYSQLRENVGLEGVLINDTELESFIRNETNKINDLLSEQNNHIVELNKLIETKTKIRLKIEENKNVIEMLNKNEQVLPVITECPHCHKKYDLELKSSILNTYNIVVLENNNKSLDDELKEIETIITNLKNKISDVTERINVADKIIKQKNKAYTDYLGWKTISESKKDLLEKIKDYDDAIKQADAQKKELEKKKDEIKNSTCTAKSRFSTYYCDYLKELDVPDVEPSMIKPFYKYKLSGSQFSRSTLSLYFGFIRTKEEFNNDTFNLPFIIDSPREGEQDDLNSEKILSFILNHKNDYNQLIVASVNATDYLSEGDLKNINVIHLTNEKSKLLSPDQYLEEHTKEMLSYFEKIE